MSKIPTSLFGRGRKLVGIAGKVALNEISDRMKTFQDEKEKLLSKVKLAEDIVKTLSELKGASMKVGQLLSLDFGDYLPPEIVKVLEKLHQKSTFLPFNEINQIIKQELGSKYSKIENLSEGPMAAASIGQVHRGRIGLEEIIIKVQYPGVAESIPKDMKMLELILKQGKFLSQKSETDIGPFLSEVKEVLLKEADYRNELQMHVLYKEKFQGRCYIIPRAYAEYSTEKILVQEYIEGISLSEWIASNPSLTLRAEMADLLIRLYLDEIFVFGIVQTDPNPGNFLITRDQKLALIDFGAVKIFSKEFVTSYRKVLLAAYNQNRAAVLEESIKIGFLDPREDDEVQNLYVEMIDFLADPFRQDTRFDFGDKDFFTKSRDLSWEMTKKCRYTPPPKDLLFLHRKLGGVFIFIKRLDIKLKLKDYWHYVEKGE